MSPQHPDSFHSASTLTGGSNAVHYFRLKALESSGTNLTRLPFTLRVLLENLLRCEDGRTVTADDIKFLANWDPQAEPSREIASAATPRRSTPSSRPSWSSTTPSRSTSSGPNARMT
jgi:aconitate hydratase